MEKKSGGAEVFATVTHNQDLSTDVQWTNCAGFWLLWKPAGLK